MPTPPEVLLDPISLVVISMYGALMVWEAIFPAKALPRIPYWKLKGISSFILFFYLSTYVPLFIDPILAAYQLFDISHWGLASSATLAILIYELGVYLWHWGMHHSNFLWRSFHQLHHSAERLDTYGAFFFSPLDMLGFTLLGSICFALLVGLSPQAITIFLLVSTFLGMFQHANIRTPHWLGFVVQRPESHAIHHGKGIHRYNYSDLPIFDILFGTFRNPKGIPSETGFYDGASNRILDMLLFRDVSRPSVRDYEKSQHLEEKEESPTALY